MRSSKEGLYVATFGGRLSQQSACPICQFFRSMRISPDDSKDYELRAFSSVNCNGFIDADVIIGDDNLMQLQTAFLAVVPAVTPFGAPHLAFGVQGSIYRSLPAGTFIDPKDAGGAILAS
jgi:hypothetical protein